MDVTLNDPSVTSEQDRKISAAMRREGGRLRNFIRRRVLDAAEAEDILQEVLYELVAAHRLMQPIEQAGAWLMRVARNRIIDRFRKKRAEPFSNSPLLVDDEDDGNRRRPRQDVALERCGAGQKRRGLGEREVRRRHDQQDQQPESPIPS